MKKITIYIVLALLCPFRSKEQRQKNRDFFVKSLLILCSVLLLFCDATMGQEPIKPLQIGDKLPEIFWQQAHLIYEGGTTTKQTLAPYKGKFLILDFWATWCGTCVGKLPITDSLQRENSELKIILVNNNKKDNAQTLKRFYTENAKAHPMPTVVGDTLLKAMFPHKYVPHYVFIDHKGMVMGFASYHFLNRQIMTSLLQQHQKSTQKLRYEN